MEQFSAVGMQRVALGIEAGVMRERQSSCSLRGGALRVLRRQEGALFIFRDVHVRNVISWHLLYLRVRGEEERGVPEAGRICK